MSITTLLIGLGQIGLGYDLELDPYRYVYTHARALTMHPRFALLGAVDPEGGRRATFESRYRLPAWEALDHLPRDLDPQLVIVAAPTGLHRRLVSEALVRLRPRAILCEKPLSYDQTEAREILAECESRNVVLFVNYMRRADPATIEIRRRIEAGELRAPFKGVVWYSKGFLHNGSHFVDLLGYWLGSVKAAQLIDPGRAWGEADHEPDVRLEFRNGTVEYLAAHEEDFSHYTVELVARNGRLRCERGGERVEWQSASPHPRIAGYTVLSDQVETLATGMDRYQWHVTEQLASAIDGRPHPLCTGRQALNVLESMHSVLEKCGS